MGTEQQIIQLKVRLLGISPMIWRRILVPASITLHELHGIVQVAMGWSGIHLFQFDIRSVQYGSRELCCASPAIALRAFEFRRNDRFSYTYDMGDHWRHEVRVEKFQPADPKIIYPVCTGGAGACPPEDCGGVAVFLARRDEAEGFCQLVQSRNDKGLCDLHAVISSA